MITAFSSMTGLGGKISMFLVGRGVDKVTQSKGSAHIRYIGHDTTRSVEDSVVDDTSKSTLFKR